MARKMRWCHLGRRMRTRRDERLDEGSQAFAALLDGLAGDDGTAKRVIQVDAQDLGLAEGNREDPKQRPFAAVLGCSDARVPIELIFNEGPNDLFVIRVAGNGLGSEVLGSLKYAVEHLGNSMKIIVVLGHSGCGAVSAAVDVFLDPSRYLALATAHSLRNILDRLLVVVQASAKRMHEIFGPDIARYPGYRGALIETSVVINAALAAYTVEKELKNRDTERYSSGLRRLSPRDPRGLGTPSRHGHVDRTCRSAERPRRLCRARQCRDSFKPDYIAPQSRMISLEVRLVQLWS